MARYHYYVVYKGRWPGMYHSWNECIANVQEYPNAQYKGLSTLEEDTDGFYRFNDTKSTAVRHVPRRSSNVKEAPDVNRVECLLWAVIFILCLMFLMWGLTLYIAFSMSY